MKLFGSMHRTYTCPQNVLPPLLCRPRNYKFSNALPCICFAVVLVYNRYSKPPFRSSHYCFCGHLFSFHACSCAPFPPPQQAKGARQANVEGEALDSAARRRTHRRVGTRPYLTSLSQWTKRTTRRDRTWCPMST